MPIVESLLFIIHAFHTQIRCTSALKDEDICIPSCWDQLYHLSPSEILECLTANIQRYDKCAKTAEKADQKVYKDLSKICKLVQSLFVFVLYIYNPRQFQLEVFKTVED